MRYLKAQEVEYRGNNTLLKYKLTESATTPFYAHFLSV